MQWYFCFHLCHEIISERNCRFCSRPLRCREFEGSLSDKIAGFSSNVSPINVYKSTRARVTLFEISVTGHIRSVN